MLDYRMARARVEQFPDLVNIWEASVRATHHFLSEEDIQFFKPRILHEYLHALTVICYMDVDDTIQGFIGTAQDKIEMLFLRPECIGRGLGKRLIEYAINNLEVCKVDVNEQNTDATEFYKHLGFEVTSRSPVDGTGKPYPILHMKLRALK